MRWFYCSPSERHGGFWLRMPLDEAEAEGAKAILYAAWGWDRETPLRPWITFQVEQRKGKMVLAWVTWCGFCLAVQTNTSAV